MSTHNICFHREMKKIFVDTSSYLVLCLELKISLTLQQVKICNDLLKSWKKMPSCTFLRI